MKRVMFLLVALVAAATVYAQEPEKGIKPDDGKYSFIQAQMGGQYTFSEGQFYTGFGGKVSPTAAVTLGNFFSPQMGTRLQLGGWTSKNNMRGEPYSVTYLNLNLDAMLNLSNLMGHPRADRRWNLLLITGIGYVHKFKDHDIMVSSEYDTKLHTLPATNSGALRMGLQMNWRTGKRWAVNLEVNGNLLRDDFNGQEKYAANNDATVNVLAGISYYFNKKGGNVAERADNRQIASLNEVINALRAQVTELTARNSVLREMAYGSSKAGEAEGAIKPVEEVKPGSETGMVKPTEAVKLKELLNKMKEVAVKPVETVEPGEVLSKTKEVALKPAGEPLVAKEAVKPLQTLKPAEAMKPASETAVATVVPETAMAAADTTLIGVVVFRLGKSVIDADQEIVLYNLAQYMMKHRDRQVYIASYTDNSTSTADINRVVGENRTAAIIRVMTGQYNIPANRFGVMNVNCTAQPFNEKNVWNKVRIYIKKS